VAIALLALVIVLVVFTAYLPGTYSEFTSAEGAALCWATSADAVLLRWRWPEMHRRDATYRVYRGGQLLAGDVAPVANEQQALAILGSDWAEMLATSSVQSRSSVFHNRKAKPGAGCGA
jgi:hypothetical protein